MPTYSVTAPDGVISSDAKSRIAREVTRIHAEETGAPPFFAQMFFRNISNEDYFLVGLKLSSDQIFICGHIRSGRSAAIKNNIIVRIIDAVSEAAAVPRSRVWVYLVDLPAGQMAEFGRILPEPGDEAEWVAALDADDRERMTARWPA